MQGVVYRMKQHYDSCTDAHTVDTRTTHTASAAIRVPGQVKRAASPIPLQQAKGQNRDALPPSNFIMQINPSEKATIQITDT